MVATREEFKEYCLRKLGKPVIEINVSDEQVEDRVSEAIRYYWDYHFDGTEKIYYKHKIEQSDIDNEYINIPENIIGAVRVFPIGNLLTNTSDMFNVQYQFALNDLHTIASTSMVPYFMMRQHLSLIQEMLVGQQPIRYNRHLNKVHLDMNWKRISVGQFLIIEAYKVVDPDEASDVWNDRWLQNYCTAKIKYQWGSNLSKFADMPLPGGIRFNADRILSEAQAEIEKMEDEMINSFSLPVCDMIG